MPISAVRFQWRPIHPAARPPTRGRPTDAGYDIYAIVPSLIRPGETQEIRTGIELSCAEHFYYTLEGRSSLNRRKVFVVRPIIDATYCDEVVVIMRNDGSEPYEIDPGDRIAQVLVHRKYDLQLEQVQQFSPEFSIRGRKGFGSTGR